ncbi:hypothetical protein L596_018024 [Steinernema carpocapsae]|uniref:Uncharacterized protein n=1 Tax=Steinernema carpocapsae TaxID=34508 RepID=A0A4U5N3E2_STECR|nr:hypothetical protein L596_018024 [Steinernema carpocapsae]
MFSVETSAYLPLLCPKFRRIPAAINRGHFMFSSPLPNSNLGSKFSLRHSELINYAAGDSKFRFCLRVPFAKV